MEASSIRTPVRPTTRGTGEQPTSVPQMVKRFYASEYRTIPAIVLAFLYWARDDIAKLDVRKDLQEIQDIFKLKARRNDPEEKNRQLAHEGEPPVVASDVMVGTRT